MGRILATTSERCVPCLVVAFHQLIPLFVFVSLLMFLFFHVILLFISCSEYFITSFFGDGDVRRDAESTTPSIHHFDSVNTTQFHQLNPTFMCVFPCSPICCSLQHLPFRALGSAISSNVACVGSNKVPWPSTCFIITLSDMHHSPPKCFSPFLADCLDHSCQGLCHQARQQAGHHSRAKDSSQHAPMQRQSR